MRERCWGKAFTREERSARPSTPEKNSAVELGGDPAVTALTDSRGKLIKIQIEEKLRSGSAALQGSGRKWDREFQSGLLQRRVRCELDFGSWLAPTTDFQIEGDRHCAARRSRYAGRQVRHWGGLRRRNRKRFLVFGNPSRELRTLLDRYGVTYHEPFGRRGYLLAFLIEFSELRWGFPPARPGGSARHQFPFRGSTVPGRPLSRAGIAFF
jgi:hypothetical protein